MPRDEQEWLVADQYGFFAMGTASGARTRKYHSFLSSIAGRLERNLIAHLDLSCQGRTLWTHVYQSPEGPLHHPPEAAGLLESFDSRPWPTWAWRIGEGRLSLQLAALERGGLSLRLLWEGPGTAALELRPLFAMRPLHGLGGEAVEWRRRGSGLEFCTRRNGPSAFISSDTPFDWRAKEEWYYNFYYEEERKRGYACTENLFSAGHFSLQLPSGRPCFFYLAARPDPDKPVRAGRDKLEDFVLQAPAGVIAGFPWFGEWGRDTFISLPGIVAGLVDNSVDRRREVLEWSLAVLERWGRFLETDAMLPNVITPEGPQWESADATLWWTHALASLWSLAAARPELAAVEGFGERLARFLPLLEGAIESIRDGRHRFLALSREGLVEVTADHATWMDARVDGRAMTPRTGALPEINALWLQARGLRSIWARRKDKSLLKSARAILERAHEKERPNIVFLHSLPLAPSFLTESWSCMRRDAELLATSFLTPVGLRTLAPGAPGYQPCYAGDQAHRDANYHQGPAWGWLKGHYEMAARRFEAAGAATPVQVAPAPSLSSIPGHFAELFDGEAPFTPRGCPAQAWSLATAAEARVRAEWKIDEALRRAATEIL